MSTPIGDRPSRRSAALGAAATIVCVLALIIEIGGSTEFDMAMAMPDFVVNSTGNSSDSAPGNGSCDTGGSVGGDPECTLRAAIQEANALAGVDEIHFDIPQTDAGYSTSPVGFTIEPSNLLPEITTPMILDASTQPEYTTAGRPVIEIDGNNVSAGEENGLWITGGGSTVRGFVINRFGDDAIDIEFNGGNTIVGNYVGTNIIGTTAAANAWGINIKTAGNTVGGTTVADRNVVSGNTNEGVYLKNSTSTGNTVIGNYIGTTAAGDAALPNGTHGVIVFSNAHSNQFGGLDPDEGNVIAGNGGRGIHLNGESSDGNVFEGNHIGVNADGDAMLANGNDALQISSGADNTVITGNLVAAPNGDGIEVTGSSSGTVIQGNTVGTDLAGSADWSAKYAAVALQSGASNTLIGGAADGQGNTFANSGANGANPNSISIWPSAGSGISILGNSIYGSRGHGIDLNPIGRTANDAGDGDSGPNDLLNYPVVTAGGGYRGTVTVVFDLDVPANADQYRVEFFTNPSGANLGGNWEGEALASAVVTGPGSTIVHHFDGSVGDIVTATATRIDSGSTSGFSSTSEFSVAFAVAPGHVVVNSTGNAGDSDPGNGVCHTGGTNSASAPACTLRAAIQETNASPTLSGIEFDMPATEPGHSSGVWTISPSFVLPTISSTTTIDGTTQTGWATTPVVTVDGDSAGAVNGLSISGDDVEVRGLAIGRFDLQGITVQSDAAGTIIAGNHVGTDASGLVDRGNLQQGIDLMSGSGPTTIGGTDAADRNLVSGNVKDGLVIWNSDGNTIIGNYFGTDVTGNAPLGNDQDGIALGGTSSNNTIGQPGWGNVLSGNNNDGIEFDEDLSGNVVQANHIGLGQDGTTTVPNTRHGVVIYDGVNNTRIGGTGVGEGNVISGNTASGIVIDGAGNPATTANTIEGNYIGTDDTGSLPRGNLGHGIHFFDGATGNTIGGAAADAGNVISGNGTGEGGVSITGTNSTNNVVQGNKIGTNANGDAALANNLHGVWLDDAPNNQILDNLISGNDVHGVYVYGAGTTGTSLLRNTIGTNAAMTAPINNDFDGVRLEGGSGGAVIGSPGNGNVVAGNTQHGINLNSSSDNTIQANYIGTSSGGLDIGNGLSGVYGDAFGSSNNRIGGPDPGEPNTIRFNGEGITLLSGTGNALLGNTIYDNDSLGIDLDDDGVNPNDGDDLDSGPNDRLNYPVITSATESGGVITLSGTFDVPSGSYRFEFFKNASGADPSGHGEGQQIVDSSVIAHTGSGAEPWGAGFAGAVGDVITITLTEDLGGGSFGSSSEFSAAATTVPTVSYQISGTVFEDVVGDALDDGLIGDALNPGVQSVDVHLYLDADADGITEATDTYVTTTQTDVDGAYAFTGLGADEYFVVVDSKTVSPSAGLNGGFTTGDRWAEQTYGPAARRCADGLGGTTISGGAGPCFGGRTGAASDDLTTWYSGAEHVAGVAVTTADVTAVDFGFSFNTVTTIAGGDASDDDPAANRTVQGSLRQFIQNANAVAGSNGMRFVPAVATNAVSGADSWWRIDVAVELPVVTNGATVVDGTAHDLTDGVTETNTNAKGPELELDGSAAASSDGLSITSTGNTIRDLVIGGFADAFQAGVLIQGGAGDSNVVAGAYIGTNGTGTALNGNYYGIRLAAGAGSNIVGGLVATDRNVISGNTQDGVSISGVGSDANVVRGNHIGTNAAGSAAVANKDGIDLSSGALNTVIGGSGAGARNVISGNTFQGIFANAGSTYIWGNYIGTDASGGSPIGNLRGVWINGASNSQVGSSDPLERNVISGNTFRGVVIANSASGNSVAGNYIGTDAAGTGSVPNNGPGVELTFTATGNTVGGTAIGAGNVIANNAGSGVIVNSATSTANAILGNVLRANGGLGVDLGNDTVTPNDPGDSDNGPNDLLNHPVFTSAVSSGGVISVSGTLDVPAGVYRLELFTNPSGADPSGFGEGETLVANGTILHSGSGSEPFAAAFGGAAGAIVTAIVTEDLGGGSYGSSSEFSSAITVTAAGPTVVDSSRRYSDLAPFGGVDPAGNVDGVAGAAIDFGAGAHRLTGPALDVTSGQLSLSGWIRLDALGTDPRVVAKRSTTGASVYELFVDSGTGEVVARFDVGGVVREARGGTVSTGAWHHLAATWDGADLTVFLDGAAVGATGAVGTLATASAVPATVGNVSSTDRGLDGTIDEVSVSHTARSADWIATTEVNLRAPGSFVTIGGEQTGAPAAWTVAGTTTRSGTFALVAPSAPSGTNAWATAIGVDEPGIEFESWWWFGDASGIDAAAGTRTGDVPTDQYETGLSAAGWDLATMLGATRTQQVAPAGPTSAGAWVEVIVSTDELGSTSVRVDGAEIVGPTAQTGGPSTGSVGLRAGALPPFDSWFIDDVRLRRLVHDEPTTSLGSLDRN